MKKEINEFFQKSCKFRVVVYPGKEAISEDEDIRRIKYDYVMESNLLEELRKSNNLLKEL